MNARLLTGLKFCLISSEPIFLIRGLTTAVFHLVLNSLPVSEVLTILVIRGQTVGRIFLSSWLVCHLASRTWIYLLNYKSCLFPINGAYFLRNDANVSVIASYWVIPLNSSLICKILFWKILAKSSAGSSFVLCVGHFWGSGLFVRFVTNG